MTIKKDTALCYDVKPLENNPYAWATVFIREWKGGGQVAIQSDYGDFSYLWGSIGDKTLREFMCGLDYHYFMKKTRKDTGGHKFCADTTMDNMRENILEARKEHGISKQEARELFDEVSALSDYSTEECFYTAYYHNETLYDFFHSEPPKRTMKDPACRMFWDEIWSRLVPVWRDELALTPSNPARPLEQR